MKKIKVLFLTGCTGRGGAGHSLFYLLKYLDQSRIEPLVVMPNEGTIGKKLARIRVDYRIAPRLKERFFEMRFWQRGVVTRSLSAILNTVELGLFIFELARLISKEQIGLIYCNHMMVKFIGTVAGLLCRVPVIWHCRTVYSSAFGRWFFNRLARAGCVKRIIAVSEACAANYGFAKNKVEVVHNGVDLACFDPEKVQGELRRVFCIGPETVVIGYMGRIVKWKGMDNLLTAMTQVFARRKDVVLVVIGDNPFRSSEDLLAYYRRKAVDGCFSDRIFFTGFQEDVRSYLKDIDVMLAPSITPDPCPRSVVESLAFGVPVIGTETGGIPELIQNGENGFLVDPNDVEALTEKTLSIVEDRELRRKMGLAARRSAIARHHAQEVAQRIQRILFEVVQVEKPVVG